MESTFQSCTQLTELNVSNFNTNNVNNMSSMFYGCDGLTELNVSNFNTGKVTTMYRMFYGCKNLKKLDISSFSNNEILIIGCMFYGCSNLATITADPSKWKNKKFSSKADTFANCSTKLVGHSEKGQSTTWDSDNTDGTRARVCEVAEDGEVIPGYFTDVNYKPVEAHTSMWNFSELGDVTSVTGEFNSDYGDIMTFIGTSTVKKLSQPITLNGVVCSNGVNIARSSSLDEKCAVIPKPNGLKITNIRLAKTANQNVLFYNGLDTNIVFNAPKDFDVDNNVVSFNPSDPAQCPNYKGGELRFVHTGGARYVYFVEVTYALDQ